jgi:hypothetical protein
MQPLDSRVFDALKVEYRAIDRGGMGASGG